MRMPLPVDPSSLRMLITMLVWSSGRCRGGLLSVESCGVGDDDERTDLASVVNSGVVASSSMFDVKFGTTEDAVTYPVSIC